MKKKSHLSLASYIIDGLQNEDLIKYRKSFLLGSVLPDCIPSFVTRRHTIEDTFEIFREELTAITEAYDWTRGITREFCRRLGVVIHYLADYFTFPHNSIFKGSMKEHITYEFALMDYFKKYLNSGETDVCLSSFSGLFTVDSICNFLKQAHTEYLQVAKKIATDTEYIVAMTVYIVRTVIDLLEVNFVTSQVEMA